jgi:hypothetical protein
MERGFDPAPNVAPQPPNKPGILYKPLSKSSAGPTHMRKAPNAATVLGSALGHAPRRIPRVPGHVPVISSGRGALEATAGALQRCVMHAS